MRELKYAIKSGPRTFALDEPGHGGACHEYGITDENGYKDDFDIFTFINFQNGPIKDEGVNGAQIEDLLAICIDRLEGFQSGPYKSAYNGNALHNLREALDWLNRRTRDRIARGVEGTHTI